MFLYRMFYSAVLLPYAPVQFVRDVGSANSLVICMFPWYILDWLSNLEPLTRTGKLCNGTDKMKSICFCTNLVPWCPLLTAGLFCGSSLWWLTRTRDASGWPRWCCTCSYEKECIRPLQARSIPLPLMSQVPEVHGSWLSKVALLSGQKIVLKTVTFRL